MSITLRPLHDRDIDAIVDLSLLAWAPVFDSFRQVLGPAIYRHLYPDWRLSQATVVESMCRDTEKYVGWVAERDQRVAGFILYELNTPENAGEVHLLAVHPADQQLGIATLLNNVALEQMKAQGMRLAVVGTGGDPGHAPARAAYEKVGYTALPIVRYYKMLENSP
jgi:ribosomal protein S18 acetylase RimI-like enzyme